MSEDRPNEPAVETDMLWVQTLSGQSFAMNLPGKLDEPDFTAMAQQIHSNGFVVCGEVRVPWSSIAFIGHGDMARHLFSSSHVQRPAVNIAGMVAQGVA